MATQRSILFLCDDPDTLGGLQRVLAVLVDEFTRRGYRVVITSLVGSEQRGFVDASIERVTLFRPGWITRLLQWPKLGPLHLRGRRVLRLQPQRAARRRLREQVCALNPDAVIVFDSLMAKIAAEAQLDGAKVLVQYHNSFGSLAGTGDLKRLRQVSQTVSAFLALTEADALGFVGAGFTRVRHIANPISFYPDTLPATRSPQVIALGRYHHQKALDQLVHAWAKLERKDGWHLDIFGDGPDRGLIEKTVQDMNVEASATVHGPTQAAEMLLSNAAIYALPSRFEGLCMVALEAIACGIPIVSTASGPGTEEIVRGCGLIGPVNDVDTFATNLQQLIDDANLRTAFGAAGRLKAHHYRVDRIVDLWESMIAETPPVSPDRMIG